MQAEAIEVGIVPLLIFPRGGGFARWLMCEIARLGMEKHEIEKVWQFLIVKNSS